MEMLIHEEIIHKCIGCDGTVIDPHQSSATCKRFLMPATKWRIGNCSMASHIKKVAVEVKSLNPLKASKRSVGKI